MAASSYPWYRALLHRCSHHHRTGQFVRCSYPVNRDTTILPERDVATVPLRPSSDSYRHSVGAVGACALLASHGSTGTAEVDVGSDNRYTIAMRRESIEHGVDRGCFFYKPLTHVLGVECVILGLFWLSSATRVYQLIGGLARLLPVEKESTTLVVWRGRLSQPAANSILRLLKV